MYRLPRFRSKQVVVHCLRLMLLAAVVLLVRQQHVWHEAQLAGRQATAIDLDRVLKFFPAASRLSDFDPSHGGQTVVDADGRPLGYVVQTSPIADDVIGYSGPSNTMIALDTDDVIVGIDPISSRDTPEHFQAVLNDDQFLAAFDGLSWQQAAAQEKFDAASGATLTSLAITEGVVRRLGGAQHSYRFPNPLEMADAKRFFPQAAQLAPSAQRAGAMDVLAADGQRLGGIARTSPVADDVTGYQGPTDTLIAWNDAGEIIGIAIRRSYDNDEYVGYVAEDEYFLTLFNGRSIDELAAIDLDETLIEGVSGATMTSQAMAAALIKTAGRLQQKPSAPRGRQKVLAARDIGTVAVLVGGLVMAFSRWRGHRRLRMAFQLLLVGYFGLINGDMLSQALLAGWAQAGVPWRLAPGLLLMVAAALLVPAVSKRNVYCQHICPHGAAQQLLIGRLPQRHLPPWLGRLLKVIPVILLWVVLLTALLHWPLNLASIEPFDAYLFRIAGWATIAVAVVGLIASLFVPMAYCRYGCPTGALLEYVRVHRRSDRLHWGDATAIAALIVALVLRLAETGGRWPF